MLNTEIRDVLDGEDVLPTDGGAAVGAVVRLCGGAERDGDPRTAHDGGRLQGETGRSSQKF